MNFQAGQEITPLKMETISLDLLKRYAEASGDHNVIHLSEEEAKKVGLPGVIAHGMLIASLMVERGLKFVREKNPSFSVKRVQNRFKAMTFLKEEVWVSGQVQSLQGSLLVIELVARNAAADLKTTGILEIDLSV